jgi:hypothetical protein
MSTATRNWTQTSKELPHPDSKVEWIAPSGEQVRGTFIGGCVWNPEGSNAYIYYTPTFWRYLA